MCGIVGHLRYDGCQVDASNLDSAIESLRTRGPDDWGCWIEGGAGLGHRRLSILDLSSAGHQPMQSTDGRYVIVFNGEIYNFHDIRKDLDINEDGWRSNSDTEVVLAAYMRWGVSCLDRFHGMFARNPDDTSGNLFREKYKSGVYSRVLFSHPFGIGVGHTLGTHEETSANALVFWAISGGILALVFISAFFWHVFWTFCHPLLNCGNVVYRCAAASFIGHAIHNLSYGYWLAPFFLLHLAIVVMYARHLRKA